MDRPITSPQEQERRRYKCNLCEHNTQGCCMEYKRLHPERKCNIEYGITLPHSACPINEWWKECSVVWVYKHKTYSGIETSVKLLRQHLSGCHEMFICGDKPAYIDINHIPSPAQGGKIKDSLVKLQNIIDDPRVTNDFLWMYDDTFIVQPTSIQEIAQPKFGPSPSRKGAWAEVYSRTMYLLKEGKYPTRNFSTHYPVVYNKQLLQEVLDNYEPPYLVESLYLNKYASNPQIIDHHFQFERDFRTLNPYTKILNVKVYSELVRQTLGQLCQTLENG